MQGFCQYNRGSASNIWAYPTLTNYDATVFTAGIWSMRQSSVASGTLFSRSLGSNQNDWFLAMASGDGTTMRATWRFNDNVAQTITDSSSHAVSRWIHWAMVWDGTTQSLLRDGVVVASASPAGKSQVGLVADVHIGVRDASSNPSDCFLADFFYTSAPLTAAEVRLLATGVRRPPDIKGSSLLIYDELKPGSRDIVYNSGVQTGLLVYPQTRPPQLERWSQRRRRVDRFSAPAGAAPPPSSTNSNFFFAAA